MPRRELLTPAERAELFAFPADEGELIRLATLSKSDLAFIRQHRGLPNRLGVAVQMVYLRHPGRALGVRETPNARVLELVAAQLGLAPADWNAYAVRSATRREHLDELSALLASIAPTSTRCATRGRSHDAGDAARAGLDRRASPPPDRVAAPGNT
jgi:TnpA family transposase